MTGLGTAPECPQADTRRGRKRERERMRGTKRKRGERRTLYPSYFRSYPRSSPLPALLSRCTIADSMIQWRRWPSLTIPASRAVATILSSIRVRRDRALLWRIEIILRAIRHESARLNRRSYSFLCRSCLCNSLPRFPLCIARRNGKKKGYPRRRYFDPNI